MTNKRTDKQTKRARNWHRARSEDRRLENSFENSGKDRKNRNEAQTTTKKKRKVKKKKTTEDNQIVEVTETTQVIYHWKPAPSKLDLVERTRNHPLRMARKKPR